ncbi:MAG: LPXTG cell wall anchor domain-containing protein, partial [Clostridia bacterium]|nr:LPXTG cell wall anchor domain-containing protein [Clostridia bacterium]
VLKKQDGAWIFSSFRLPYWIARDTLALNASSPATGDSAVFLLPAAALSLGGVFLAAKKRKRRGMTGADR